MDSYGNRSFYKENGEFDFYTSPNLLTYTLKSYYPQIRFDNTEQNLGDIPIYPLEYLCAADFAKRKLMVTNNTYCIHHYRGSWVTSLYEPCTKDGNDTYKRFFKKIYWQKKVCRFKRFFEKGYWLRKIQKFKST